MANYINLTIGGLNEGYGSAAGASAGYMVDGSQPYNFIINGNNSFNFTIYRNETLGCNVDPAADIYCGGELVGHLPISDNSCAIEGNVDVYGMGIRIGLYLQWTSTLLTFFYHPSTFSELLVANCTFSIAVSIAYLVIFRTLYRQEVFIVAMLLSMTLLMIPLEILDFVLYYRDPKRLTGSLKQKLVSGAATTAEAPSAGERPAEGEVPAAASSSAHPAPSPSSKAAPAPAMPAIVIVLRGVHRNVKKNIHHIGGIAWFIATAFLLIIVAFQYWSGTKMGQPNPEGCHPKLLWTFYTQPPYENVMKAMYLLLAILAGLAMIVYLLVQASDAASVIPLSPHQSHSGLTVNCRLLGAQNCTGQHRKIVDNADARIDERVSQTAPHIPLQGIDKGTRDGGDVLWHCDGLLGRLYGDGYLSEQRRRRPLALGCWPDNPIYCWCDEFHVYNLCRLVGGGG